VSKVIPSFTPPTSPCVTRFAILDGAFASS
jgi:hypothetical protein